MTLTSTLSSLGSALYELPKKAVAYATLKEMGIDKSNCEDVGTAKFMLNGLTRDVNLDTGKLTDEGLRKYATDGFFEPENLNTGYSKVESVIRLKDYVVENCNGNINDLDNQISEKTQLAMNYATDFAQEHGREIPFFGNPILDAAIAVGILITFAAGIRYSLSKLQFKLFYKI